MDEQRELHLNSATNLTDMRNIFFLAFALYHISVAAQPALNQSDPAGKKHGKWIVYLDKEWKAIEDSVRAIHHRYTYFDHGVNIYPMGRCGGKGFKLVTDSASPGKVVDGTYKWYDAKGRLSSVHTFKNGEYVSCKEYFTSGGLSQHFDYTKKCEGQEHGWTVFIYDKKGNLQLASPTCKDKDGNWPKMR
jgi:antitoxin component YwqK of YwqJK toxin-antitoxin module